MGVFIILLKTLSIPLLMDSGESGITDGFFKSPVTLKGKEMNVFDSPVRILPISGMLDRILSRVVNGAARIVRFILLEKG